MTLKFHFVEVRRVLTSSLFARLENTKEVFINQRVIHVVIDIDDMCRSSTKETSELAKYGMGVMSDNKRTFLTVYCQVLP